MEKQFASFYAVGLFKYINIIHRSVLNNSKFARVKTTSLQIQHIFYFKSHVQNSIKSDRLIILCTLKISKD